MIPKRVGARLTLPRDLQVAYTIGRMGAVTASDLGPLFWGAAPTARVGFRRLTKLGLVRSFPRPSPSCPNWYSLTPPGLEWVLEEVGCSEAELRRYSGLGRVNLAALAARNRFWVTLLLACRRAPAVRVALFQPEWELRRAKPVDVDIVPDALAVLARRGDATPAARPEVSHAFMVEFDSGAERSFIWREKAVSYDRLVSRGALYGVTKWSVLALVPSVRRARTVAAAIVKAGGRADVVLGVSGSVQVEQILGRVLWNASDLMPGKDVRPTRSLVDTLVCSAEGERGVVPAESIPGQVKGRRAS